jgi:hypothetical protein
MRLLQRPGFSDGVDLVCRGTIEERIDELIASKRQLGEHVVGDGAEKLRTEMSNDGLVQLVTLGGLGEKTCANGVKFRSAWCSGSGTVICRLMSEDSGLRMTKSPVSRSPGWGGAPLDLDAAVGAAD